MLDLGTSFLASVSRDPKAVAVVDGDIRLSYRDWYAKISAVVAGFAELRLAAGDRLVTVLQNRWEAATLHWACQFAGVVITPINWRAKVDEIDYAVQNSGAKAIAFEQVSAENVADSGACHSLARISVAQKSASSDTSFTELVAADAPPAAPRVDADAISLMLYTSGTTAKPKGVPRSHRAERAAAVAHVAQNLYGHGERTLGVMPLYHTMGVRSLLSMSLIGGRFVCLPRFDIVEALRLIEKERITKLSDAFRPDLFVNHYGSTEIYTFTINQDAARKPGSAGRAGINQMIRIVKLGASNVDEIAAPGEEGEIAALACGDEAFEGYWQRPEATAQAFRQGWYMTGDTGYADEDGDIYVTGRVDDMIITGGENVSPVEIESCLSLHPAVAEVAVVGLPDERWGKIVAAFIRRRSDVAHDELDSHYRTSGLANFKRPRRYIFVREIPKSPVGKLLRRKLVVGEYEAEPRPTAVFISSNQTA